MSAQPAREIPEAAAPSMPVMLVTVAADALLRAGLPRPVQVEASERYGLTIEIATHPDLRAWMRYMRLPVQSMSSQPFVRHDGVLCQLSNVYGRWRGGDVRLHCCEPIDAIAALRDGPHS